MEPLKHECGVAMIRLLKPLDYYQQKYGTWMYGLNKLYLMMEKQHNRGQEGAGIATVKLGSEPGREYMFRERAEGKDAITKIFAAEQRICRAIDPDRRADMDTVRRDMPFAGNLLMGHLRYSTTGKSGLSYVHPFLRRNNWQAKNLCLCGNFNMTNIEDVFHKLTEQGMYPRIYSDSYIMLELMGHRLDREAERNFADALKMGLTGLDITRYINANIDIVNVLRTTMPHFDGGYVVCGATGSGEMFAMRDPHGIRPAFYYKDEEIVAVASERPVLQTTFDLEAEEIHELTPGSALVVRANGNCALREVMPKEEYAACSFERIYFSRGSDRDIYRERKQLGEQLLQPVIKAIDGDIDNTVVSFIPNTAEVAFYGLLGGLYKYNNRRKIERIKALGPNASDSDLEAAINSRVRSEKVAWKDIKLRTFITESQSRNDLASHVYDITYGSLRPGRDNLVVIDDSIVRGTTLRESIIRILNRLQPKRIVLVSSAPQIRYPDYYGIDMARLEEFCVFRAAMMLHKERGNHPLIDRIYRHTLAELKKPMAEMRNCVREIYEPFSVEELNEKVVEMLRPKDVRVPISIVFQSIEGLHQAIPDHPGDWYFTGHYPTPGGTRQCLLAFKTYIETIYQNETKF